MEKYTCICGKSFQSEKSLWAHEASCKEFYLQKYGNIDAYINRLEKIRQAARTQNQEYNKYKKDLIINKKQEDLEKWIAEQHTCEICGKIMTEKYGSGRFCCRSCANKRSHTEETKQKISTTLSLNKQKMYCKICGKELNYRNISGYCSYCFQHLPKSEEVKKKQSKIMKERGYPRWNIHREKLSFAENFFAKVLDRYNIQYIHDYSVKNTRNYNYYLDFYIVKNGVQLDLEIDGKQHELPKRKIHDIKRDTFLTSINYVVYRIKWNELRSINGKKLMEQKINTFLNFYNSF